MIVTKKRTLWQQIWKYRTSYLFIAPFFALFIVFQLYPLVYAIALSFYQWDGGRGPWYFVGASNYIDLFTDDRVFLISLKNSLIYWIILVPLLVGGSLVLAVIFNSSWLRARGILRTTLFLPYVTSGLIMALIFLSLLDDDFGWLNAGLAALNLPTVPWLRSTTFSIFGVVLVILWRNLGYFMIIMLAGLQSIDVQLYEAAAIDGASSWQIFWSIIVPLMRPILLFVTIISTIMVLNMFEVVFGLTGGGPEYSSQPLMLTLYQRAFVFARFGAGSALAVIISIITLCITFVQLRLLRDRN